MERELRYEAIEGRIGDVTDMASGTTERARATDVKGGKRLGGFDSVDDLDCVPGFPKSFLTELKDRVTL